MIGGAAGPAVRPAMDIRQLTYFAAIADEGTFTAAALRLNVAQSAVSHAIAGLEQELGTPLLERGAREVSLTPAGRALLPRCRDAIAAMAAARAAVDDVVGGLSGEVRIGTVSSASLQLDLPGLLAGFHAAHPEVRLRLSASGSGSHGLITELAAGRLDLALVGLSETAVPGVRLREIARTPLVLVVGDSHPLADADGVALEQFTGEPFVDFPIGYGTRTVADAAFAGAGLDREVVLECADIATAVGFVAHGLGVALLPEPAAASSGGVRALRLPQPGPVWTFSVAVATVRPMNPAATALLERLDAAVLG